MPTSPNDLGMQAPDAGVTTPAKDAGVPMDASVDAGPSDTGCPPYSHAVEGTCETELSWSDLPTGPPARDHHNTFLYAHGDEATLYVTGGVDEAARRARNDLWFAHLGPEGEFSSWQQGPAPTVWQSGSAVSVIGSRAYIISGKTLVGSRLAETPKVLSLSFGTDGQPQGWREEQPLPSPSFHGTAVSIDNRWIYVIGGMVTQPSVATSTVWKAEVMQDGTLSPWTVERALPEGRSHHAAFVHGRRLFVLGGINGSGVGFRSESYPDYLVAEIDASGQLSEWTRVDLPFVLSTHSAAVVDDRLFLFGGLGDGFATLDTVQMARFDGSALLDWQTMAPLLFARAHVHHTPVWRGNFYTVGGNTGDHVPIDRALQGKIQ